MNIIFNSSPIIFLSKLEYLNLIMNQFDKVYIPKAVLDEIKIKDDKITKSLINLIDENKIIVKEITLSKLSEGLRKRLGKGESEAITLAIELNTDYVILDDNVARKEAIRIGLTVKGTLAIIKKLMYENIIEIEPNLLYEKIKKIGFRVKKDIFDEIFR